MSERQWYPYAPDQQFGVRAAADSEALDRLLALMESRQPQPPRPGNKAPIAVPAAPAAPAAPAIPGAPNGPVAPASWRPVAEWLAGPGTRGSPGGPPSTTASALDASPWVRSDG